MDDTLLWMLLSYVIKLPIVGFMLLAVALSVSLVNDALRDGATFAIEPARSIKRAKTPLRYWMYVTAHVLFVVILSIAIYLVLIIYDYRDLPNAPTSDRDHTST